MPKRKTREEVLLTLTKVSKGKYMYNLPKYNGSKMFIDIICPEHGLFSQRLDSHLDGHGCPKCANYSFRKDKPAFLYYLQDLETGLYKIGITNNEPKKRFGSRKKIKLIKTWMFLLGKDALTLETEVLEENAICRIRNENFKDVGGVTEFFNKNILENIEQQIEKVKD